MNTVLITGCSSGFGLDTASYFLDRGWTVIATMRTPRDDLLPPSDHLRILPLDVTDTGSIARAVDAAGPLDVLVNNAGVGMVGPLEGVSMDKIRELIETNTLGTIAMTQAVLPQMREQGSGVIVNVTSGVTFQPLPLMSIYTASKAAVNAFTESVALELAPLGVRVRIVIPGRAPETPFGDNARGTRRWRRRCSPASGPAATSPTRATSQRPYGAPPLTPPVPCACQPARTPSPALGPRRLPAYGLSGLARLCANCRPAFLPDR
jgi:NAD(P)-dependent dehydrogenase (short-subunit alcohol dehydrogenase family)